ncbi:helix-turn-helix domain-containing protein [Nocardia fluminea]|uniref:helix-turn-helix domain-containing protein n=1 Tax=Nocardia fluminea TaxID=134984 RepID=UPI003664C90A
MLGLRLQQLRRELGLTQQEVGEKVWASGSKISRIESGLVRLDRIGVVELLAFYGVSDPSEHDKYLSLVDLGRRPGWWHRDSDSLPKGFELLNLESAADLIRCYEPAVVPELLQTPEYARAALQLAYPAHREPEIDRLLSVRLRRQQIIGRDDSLYLWILVEEGALQRRIGGDQIWRNQLEHLARMSNEPRISVQIVGEAACGPARAGGAFVYLRFVDRQLPDIVCVTQPTSTLYLEGENDINQYLQVANLLAVEATKPRDASGSIEKLLASTQAVGA